MPASRQPYNFKFPCIQLGQSEGTFVAFASGTQEHCFVESRGQQAGKTGSQVNDWRGDHSAVQMIQTSGALCDGVDDFWVPVAEQTRHLSGCPVHNLLSICRPQVHAFSPGHDIWEKFGTESETVRLCCG